MILLVVLVNDLYFNVQEKKVKNSGSGGASHTYVASHTFVGDSAYVAPNFDLTTIFLKTSLPYPHLIFGSQVEVLETSQNT